MQKLLVVVSIGMAGVWSRPCRAQELVTNGGFETGTFSGWTEFGETNFDGVNTNFVHSGAHSAFFGPYQTGGIQQTLAAGVDDQLQVSFWYVSEFGDTPNSMLVTLGSTTLLNIANVTTRQYVHFSTVVMVQEANPVLSFTFHDPPDYLNMDDVSVIVISRGGGSCGSADFNHDGDAATDADIEAFFACLAGSCCAACDSADFNGDGDAGTDADIEAFFRVLAGGSC